MMLTEIEKTCENWKLLPAINGVDKVTETAGKCADHILEIIKESK